MNDDTIECPHCLVQFTVIWKPTYDGEKPEYCPMCGDEMDYAEAAERRDKKEKDWTP